jgi:hypothetical protein
MDDKSRGYLGSSYIAYASGPGQLKKRWREVLMGPEQAKLGAHSQAPWRHVQQPNALRYSSSWKVSKDLRYARRLRRPGEMSFSSCKLKKRRRDLFGFDNLDAM